MSGAGPCGPPPASGRLGKRETLAFLSRDPFTILATASAVGFAVLLLVLLAAESAPNPLLVALGGMLLSVAVIWLALWEATRLRAVERAVARAAGGEAWRLLMSQDSARALRAVGVDAWPRVWGWKGGYLAIDRRCVWLWRLRGWGAEPIWCVPAEQFLGATACRDAVSDWHSSELPGLEMLVDHEPTRLVVFPAVVSPASASVVVAMWEERLNTWKAEG